MQIQNSAPTRAVSLQSVLIPVVNYQTITMDYHFGRDPEYKVTQFNHVPVDEALVQLSSGMKYRNITVLYVQKNKIKKEEASWSIEYYNQEHLLDCAYTDEEAKKEILKQTIHTVDSLLNMSLKFCKKHFSQEKINQANPPAELKVKLIPKPESTPAPVATPLHKSEENS